MRYIFILIILAIFPLLDLLHPGLPITHDGQDHVARIANFYLSLSEGHIVPRWAANLNWGYGHPILMFLYPLPSYVASFFHMVGFSFVDSTKLVFALAFIASFFTMYIWISSVWGRLSGITAAILYAFAPYRFVDLYVRGAIGEHMAFIFPPLICYGLFRRKFWLISLSTALLILSHNALSLLFLPVIGMYAFYLAVYERKEPLRFLAFSLMGVMFGFLFSAFYWVPGVFEGKYTLRDIVTAGEFAGRFVPWLSFIYSPWSYGGSQDLSKWLGAGQILTLILSTYVLEKHTKYRRFIIAIILLLFFSLFMMTGNSKPLWDQVTLLQKFQFPWRLLSVTTFLIALLGGLVLHLKRDKQKRWVALLICSITILATIPMWRAKAYTVYPESFFTGIYNSTTDTGESSPIWSVRFMETRPEALSFVYPPNGTIATDLRNTTERQYRVMVTEPSRFIENTLYFPGWQVYVNGKKLPVEKLIFQDPTYRGLMTFDLDPGTYDINFVFTDTRLRQFSNRLSLLSFVIFFIFIGTIRLIWRKKE